MTILYFVRHAEPNFKNKNDRLRELSEQGMKDREQVSHFLKDKSVEALISSPYKRAYDTLLDFANKSGMQIQTIEDFRERAIGTWVEDFKDFSKRQWMNFDYKREGGESLREVQDRNIRALYQLLNAHHHGVIAIGTHGTALSTIINYFDRTFAYHAFEAMVMKMPWIVKIRFKENQFYDYHIYDIMASTHQ